MAACRLCAQTHCLVCFHSITSTSCSWAGRWTAFTLLDSVRARNGCRTPVTKWEGRVGSGLHAAAKVTCRCCSKCHSHTEGVAGPRRRSQGHPSMQPTPRHGC